MGNSSSEVSHTYYRNDLKKDKASHENKKNCLSASLTRHDACHEYYDGRRSLIQITTNWRQGEMCQWYFSFCILQSEETRGRLLFLLCNFAQRQIQTGRHLQKKIQQNQRPDSWQDILLQGPCLQTQTQRQNQKICRN